MLDADSRILVSENIGELLPWVLLISVFEELDGAELEDKRVELDRTTDLEFTLVPLDEVKAEKEVSVFAEISEFDLTPIAVVEFEPRLVLVSSGEEEERPGFPEDFLNEIDIGLELLCVFSELSAPLEPWELLVDLPGEDVRAVFDEIFDETAVEFAEEAVDDELDGLADDPLDEKLDEIADDPWDGEIDE